MILYIAIILILCGIIFDVINLIIGKVMVKNKTKNEVVAQEVYDKDAVTNGGDNVVVPRHELKRILWELNELKRSTNASLNILKENAR